MAAASGSIPLVEYLKTTFSLEFDRASMVKACKCGNVALMSHAVDHWGLEFDKECLNAAVGACARNYITTSLGALTPFPHFRLRFSLRARFPES